MELEGKSCSIGKAPGGFSHKRERLGVPSARRAAESRSEQPGRFMAGVGGQGICQLTERCGGHGGRGGGCGSAEIITDVFTQ